MRTCHDFDCARDVPCLFVSRAQNVWRQGGRLIIIELGPRILIPVDILPDRRLGCALYVAPEEATPLLRGKRKASPARLCDGCVFGDEIGPLPPLNLGCVEESLADGRWLGQAFGRLLFRSFPCAKIGRCLSEAFGSERSSVGAGSHRALPDL